MNKNIYHSKRAQSAPILWLQLNNKKRIRLTKYSVTVLKFLDFTNNTKINSELFDNSLLVITALLNVNYHPISTYHLYTSLALAWKKQKQKPMN